MMEFFRQLSGTIFYILFFIWIFLKFKNIFLVYKLKCKDSYKEIKRNVKNNKTPKLFKYGKIFIIAIIALIVLYIISVIISLALVLFILVITGFGIALETEGLTWLKLILAFFYLYSSSFKYGIYIITIAVYLIYYTALTMGIYNECLYNKELKQYKR